MNLRIISTGIMLALLPQAASAQTYRLEGAIGDQYPIKIELNEREDGTFAGRYAYLSTLRKYGDVKCSWLYISPSHDQPYSRWVVRDCKNTQVEDWYNVSFNNGKYLTARMTNTRGAHYDVVATADGQPKSKEPLDSYFRQHIGEVEPEFNMFADSRIRTRLVDLMGLTNFNALKNIYQVHGSYEYHNGMFWSSGFMAHQCCDPATVWAYDTYNNSFYAWIRQDGQDYWWSESGEIPIKFQELVSDRF